MPFPVINMLTCPLSWLTRRVGSCRFGSMPNLPIYNIMIYCAGVEVHVLPSRVPPKPCIVFRGVLISSYDVKHSFLPMGSKLDSRQFGLMGRRNSCLRIGAFFLFEVERAAACTARAAHNHCSLPGQWVVRRSLTGCPQFLMLACHVSSLTVTGSWHSPEYSILREACAARLPPFLL